MSNGGAAAAPLLFLPVRHGDPRCTDPRLRRPRLFGNDLQRFERLLRAVEYFEACRQGTRYCRTFLYLRLHLAPVRLGFTILPDVSGPGLMIAHRGAIVMNSRARVGANSRPHACTNPGTRPGAPEGTVPATASAVSGGLC